MKRIFVLLTALVMIGGILVQAACATSTAPAQNSVTAKSVQPRVIKFAYSMPRGASIAVGFDWWGPEFEKRTSGRYEVEIYPSQTLVKIAAALDAVRTDAVEMVFTTTAAFPKQFPLNLVTQLPSLGFPMETIVQHRAATAAVREYIETTPEAKIEHNDWVLITPMVLDPYNLVSKKKEIKNAADFRGLKVGGTGPKMEVVTDNNGAHVAQSPPEAYMNLDKGVIDAVFITVAQAHEYRIFEIANFYSAQEFGNGGGIVIMNKEFYNSMGAEDQKILVDTWVEAHDVSSEGSMSSMMLGLTDIATYGQTVHKPTAEEAAAWDVAMIPAQRKWESDARAIGLSDDVISRIEQKWRDIRARYITR